jgi:hypothetical protein
MAPSFPFLCLLPYKFTVATPFLTNYGSVVALV